MGCTITLPPTTRKKISNFKLCLPNVPLNVLAFTTTIGTSTFLIIPTSNHRSDGGGEIKFRFRIWQRWQETRWWYLHLVVRLNGCSVSLDALLLGKGVA